MKRVFRVTDPGKVKDVGRYGASGGLWPEGRHEREGGIGK